ncbi:MAG: sulfotransferase [Pseudomonadota bacterium]
MTTPNFIIGGTLPAGSGHLYGLLKQHPEVYLAEPMQPECNFFVKSGQYEQGIGHYLDTWFADVKDQVAIGERSSLLLSSEAGPARLRAHFPQMKLIFLVRNPVDRAYANYRFTVLAGFDALTFEQALDAEDARVEEASKDAFWAEIQPHAYFRRGLYAEQVDRWYDLFPAEQILLMRSDQLIKNQVAALERIFAFLGIRTDVNVEDFPDFSSPSVVDAALQSRLREETPVGFDHAIQRLRQEQAPESDIDRMVRANVKASVEPLPTELRARLTERYRPSNDALLERIDFNIDDWFDT